MPTHIDTKILKKYTKNDTKISKMNIQTYKRTIQNYAKIYQVLAGKVKTNDNKTDVSKVYTDYPEINTLTYTNFQKIIPESLKRYPFGWIPREPY